MAHADDDPPTEPGTADAPTTRAPSPPAHGGSPEGAGTGAGEPATTPGAEAPQRRRRRRRRRRGPRPPGEAGAPLAAQAGEPRPEGSAPEAREGATAAPEAATHAPREPGPPGAQPSRGPRRRWRPRRNRGPHPPGAAPGGEGQAAGAQGEAAPPTDEAPRAPIGRGRRERDFRAERRAAQEATQSPPREGERDRGPRGKGPRRDRDQNRDRRGPPRRHGKGPPGRGRDERQAKPEPKLYTTESVVDRGFEDVPNPEAEGETMRVHWTISKRTVADQRTTKPVSMLYILKRGETEAEFVNLALARAAVNKTIVHPEKLTLSKEQHALARTKK